MNELTARLAVSAKQNGICREWGDRLSGCSDDQIDKMMIMYRKGIDFCMNNNWPDIGTFREYKDRVRDHGVHVDENCELKNDRFAVLLGGCNASVSFDQWSVGEIYIRHDSVAEIVVSGRSFVRIDTYDQTKVTIKVYDQAKVTIKNHQDGYVAIERYDDAKVKLNNNWI